MSLIIGLVIFIALGILGRRHLINRLNTVYERQKFAIEFIEKLNEYVSSHGKNMTAYTWLVRNSSRMQSESGHYGIATKFITPLDRYQITNYHIFLNAIPDLRSWFSSKSKRTVESYYALIFEAIQRYLGFLEELETTRSETLKSPLNWVVEGVSIVLSIPILLLGWIGILSSSTVINFSSSNFMNIFGKIVFLFGIVASIVGLIVDWQRFLEILRSWFP